MKKICFISTINHNIGDDFVREGISYFLEKRFGKIEMFNIHKHIPLTVRREFEWIYSSGLTHIIDKLPRVKGRHLSKVLDILPIIKATDKILNSDILIQSGAPVYWCHSKSHCANNGWYKPLILKRYKRYKSNMSFLNFAAGSCQRYFSDGSEFSNCNRCKPYIREIHNLARITTVRDALAKYVLNSLGLDAPIIACPSIFARERLNIKKEEPTYVCLNYMRVGGHYDFGQNIDTNFWKETFASFYNEIKKKYNCIFVCHNKQELQDAKRIDPHAKTFFSKDYRKFLKFYAQAKFGVVNRVHAAFAIASFGRPSFVIGNDSRARMVEEIGLRHTFVAMASIERLLSEFERLLREVRRYPEKFSSIRKRAYKDYMSIVSNL